MTRPPLVLHFLAHPESEKAVQAARGLMARFVEPPASGGLRVPVLFTPDRGDGLPPPLEGEGRFDLDAADHTIVVLLADARMARTQGPGAVGKQWHDFLAGLIEGAPPGAGRHHVLPVALDETGFRLSDTRHILGAREEGERLLGEISFHVAARAIELLERGSVADGEPGRLRAPVRLFISHAKADLSDDGSDPAHVTMKALTDLPVERWFDAGNIATGQEFEKAIGEGIRDASIMLAFYTDHYGSRSWCRREVLDAKALGAHILIVDALREGEPRLFPYLGNVPVVRWQAHSDETNARRVVEGAVREALRFKHNRALMRRYAAEGEVVLAAAPEALTLAYEHGHPEEERTFVYPDPPLGNEELSVLRRLRPRARFVTPLGRIAARFGLSPAPPVAVSISASADAGRYGLSAEHQASLSDEIHLYLLAAGLGIGYGGALKGGFEHASNFTLRLFELVRSHSPAFAAAPGSRPFAPISNFAPWPLVIDYGDEEWALFDDLARYVDVGRPALPWSDETIFPARPDGRLAPRTAQQRYAWQRGLTAMREQMTTQTRARVVIGGRMHGFAGLVPGVVEEAWLSMVRQRPLFLVGAFGGAARAVCDLLRGVERREFDRTAPGDAVPDYGEAVACYERHGGDFADLARMGADFRARASAPLPEVLNNGLDEQANRELMACTDAPRIAELILTGLSRLEHTSGGTAAPG